MQISKTGGYFLGAIVVMLMALTGVVTYVVDDHFDYVAGIEDQLKDCGQEVKASTQEVLDLKSALVPPASK